MPNNQDCLWRSNSEEFVDRMTYLLRNIMIDYEACDDGLSPEEVVKEFNECMGISWPWEWIRGCYRPTRPWKWVEAIDKVE
jgi:hypothetical protein